MEHNPVTVEITDALVKYTHPDYNISDVKITNNKVIKFKSTEIYINYMINFIKDKIIKYCKDLRYVKIYINVFNKDNIIHRFFLTVYNIINDLQKKKQIINFKKNIIIVVIENKKLKFFGNIDFNYL